MIKQFILILTLIISIGTFAQNPKRFYKNGLKHLETNQYNEAITQFSHAIKLNEAYTEAYVSRAKIYIEIGKLNSAAKDYEKAAMINPKVVDYFFEAGKLNYQTNNYNKALIYLSDAVILDNEHFQAYQYKSFSHIKLSEYKNGIVAINRALNIKETYVGYYVKGVANDSLKNYQQAIVNYQKSIEFNSSHKKSFFALTNVYIKSNELEKALKTANSTVNNFPKSPNAYEIRSLVYYKMQRLPNAINDLSKLETLIDDHTIVLFTRGKYYFEYNLFQNAKSDFTQVIAISQKNYEAIYWRGRSNEEMLENIAAAKDYRNYLILTQQNNIASPNITDAKKRTYYLNKEETAPVVIINTPKIIEPNKLTALFNTSHINIEGYINDKSPIKYLIINEDTILTNRDKSFSHSLNITESSIIKITASDIYNNKSISEYSLFFIENNPPLVKITSPYAGDNNEIYLDSEDNNLFIQGVINDQSKIKEIIIDNERAAFNNTELNPQFSTIINIKNKNSISIKAVDEFNNITEMLYTINRSGAIISDSNPMGKTWFVFIENSDYEVLTSLEGPLKDVNTMKSALANYEIHNFIHKKNMTKTEMERFFSIELRDLVKENNVNSLLVWYAGHGKLINETGYWIPTDGNIEDEFTYFNINSLKAGMLSYNSYITHTLVVTDACESGPTFYLAMRSTNNERSCDDETATKFKSSQVFSSAGNELASDNSQFTKTFAKTLQFNEKGCISIESIAYKVIKATSNNGGQKPLFGKISGFEDENGTFFFVKKP